MSLLHNLIAVEVEARRVQFIPIGPIWIGGPQAAATKRACWSDGWRDGRLWSDDANAAEERFWKAGEGL